MSSPSRLARGAEFPFTDRDFAFIAETAKVCSGLHLEAAKKPLVYSRLARRLRARGLTRFSDYCRLLGEDLAGEEKERMLSALTTNVTHFFREAHHFEQLAHEVLPPLLVRAKAGGRVRIWSAACSSGQEPYSIAATVLERCPEAPRLDLRILATDLDTEILTMARAATYSAEELDAVPRSRRGILFKAATEASEKHVIQPDILSLVAFRPLNLIGDWPMRGGFDAIFCRNVAIYFDKPTQQRLWSRFADRLSPGGFLFIGHSERLSGPAEALFETAGVTAYRRIGDAPGKSRRKTWV